MKRLNDADYCNKLRDKLCRLETEDVQRRTVEYYTHAILSIEEARALLASYSQSDYPVLRIDWLKRVLAREMPLHGYWEFQRLVCDTEQVVAMALVDILFVLVNDSVPKEPSGKERTE